MKIPFEGVLGIYTSIVVLAAIFITSLMLKRRSDKAEREAAKNGAAAGGKK
jgi:hypothetical protein